MGQTTQISREYDKKIQELISNNYSQSSQTLSLSRCPQQWSDVLMQQNWTKIQALFLTYCQISDSGAKILGGLYWPNIQILSICEIKDNQERNNITVTGLKQLLKQNFKDKFMGVKSLVRLKQLNLSKNNIGSQGVKFLIKADIPLLTTLNLSRCCLGNEGIKHVMKSTWPKLSSLSLADNKLNFDGCIAVYKNNWKQLSNINLCMFNDGIAPLGALGLVGAIWNVLTEVQVQFDCQHIGKDVSLLIYHRFR